jgi:hypothetical protein
LLEDAPQQLLFLVAIPFFIMCSCCNLLIYLFTFVFGRYANTIASPAGQTNNMMPKSISKTRWRRVILKISGVALAGTGPNNIDPKVNCALLHLLKLGII